MREASPASNSLAKKIDLRIFDEPGEAIHFAQHAKRRLDLAIVSRGLSEVGERIRDDAAYIPTFSPAHEGLEESLDRLLGARCQVSVADEIDEQIRVGRGGADRVGLRGTIEPGHGNEREGHRLIRLCFQALSDRADRGAIRRIDEDEMAEQGRRRDELIGLAFLAPKLGDGKRDSAALEVANVDRIEFAPMADDETFAALRAAR